MDLYQIWWPWPKYIKAYASSIRPPTLNSVQVCTCQYKMFRGTIFYGTQCITVIGVYKYSYDDDDDDDDDIQLSSFHTLTNKTAWTELVTSVTQVISAPYCSSNSITLIRFFLHAMCNAVNPFCHHTPVYHLHTYTATTTRMQSTYKSCRKMHVRTATW